MSHIIYGKQFAGMEPGMRFDPEGRDAECLAAAWSAEDAPWGLVRCGDELWCVLLVDALDSAERLFAADYDCAAWKISPCPKGSRLRYLVNRWLRENVFPKIEGGKG